MSAHRKRRGGRYTPPKPRPILLTEFECESCGGVTYFIHPDTCPGRRCDCHAGLPWICDDCRGLA